MTCSCSSLGCYIENGGRERLFDRALERVGRIDADLIADMVEVYRRHRPRLRLFPGVQSLLISLKSKGYLTGIITDGLPLVQRSKVEALAIEPFINTLVFTAKLGADCSKPNLIGYEVALKVLGIPPNEAVYVGDNEATSLGNRRKSNSRFGRLFPKDTHPNGGRIIALTRGHLSNLHERR